jgi:hypothetical protein
MVLGSLYYLTGRLAQRVSPTGSAPGVLSTRVGYAWKAIQLGINESSGILLAAFSGRRLGLILGMLMVGALAGAGAYMVRHRRWAIEKVGLRRYQRRRRAG